MIEKAIITWTATAKRILLGSPIVFIVISPLALIGKEQINQYLFICQLLV